MKRIVSFLLFCISGSVLNAQQFRPLSSTEMYDKLQQLNVLGTVMYMAAHPDDENTRLISYLVHHDHIRTIYLSLTRGDGGQNILGNEQGSTLGLIRTHELMEARKIDGAEQLFTHVIDFGYTKSPEETFKFWSREQLIRDVSAAFQQYKPDVIICRFPTTGEGGHGQHTVSAIIAGDVYKQIAQQKASGKADLWQPTRLLFNSFRFGDRNTTSEDQFKLPINQYEALLGEGYGEMAGRSRSVHKSQGAGTPQSVGITNEYFKLIDGQPVKTSLYDNIDISWGRVGRKEIGTAVQKLIDNFAFVDPSRNITALLAIRKQIETVKDPFWKAQKLKEIDEIIVSAAGIMAEALADNPDATPGSTVPVTLNLISRSHTPVTVETIAFQQTNDGNGTGFNMAYDSLYKVAVPVKINSNEALTEPYWLRQSAQTGAYQYDAAYAGVPEAENDVYTTVNVKIGAQPFSFKVPVSYKVLDPVRGDVVERIHIVPAVSIEPYNALFVFEKDKPQQTLLKVKTFAAISNADLQVSFKNKNLTTVKLGALKAGTDTLIPVTVPTTDLEHAGDNSYISFNVSADGTTYNRGRHMIRYNHIPELQYFTDARIKAVRKDWQVAVKKVGYIEGAGDYVDAVLNLSGLNVERIPAGAINNQSYLNNFDAIVIGIRAYNTQSQMGSWMPALMQYVQQGGTLIVQYNTNQNLMTGKFGPYPFKISRDRVTEEDAKVTFTDPNARLLQFPNKITEKDFDNWVQERGVYYPADWDKQYKTMLAMHDTGEKDLEGAILQAQYGKGQFIYTSLAFFRQLPAGNTGAIKLMMNMLSAGK
jgi:LmbE family N-acetylglucosaminyl deacetylase